MKLAVMIVMGTAQALIYVIELCMLIRAILSWFPISDDNPILNFVYMVTEPVVAPVRRLFERLNWFQNLPIDISFLVAYLLLTLVSSLLPLFA